MESYGSEMDSIFGSSSYLLGLQAPEPPTDPLYQPYQPPTQNVPSTSLMSSTVPITVPTLQTIREMDVLAVLNLLRTHLKFPETVLSALSGECIK